MCSLAFKFYTDLYSPVDMWAVDCVVYIYACASWLCSEKQLVDLEDPRKAAYSGFWIARHLSMAAGAGVLCWVAADDLMSEVHVYMTHLEESADLWWR